MIFQTIALTIQYSPWCLPLSKMSEELVAIWKPLILNVTEQNKWVTKRANLTQILEQLGSRNQKRKCSLLKFITGHHQPHLVKTRHPYRGVCRAKIVSPPCVVEHRGEPSPMCKAPCVVDVDRRISAHLVITWTSLSGTMPRSIIAKPRWPRTIFQERYPETQALLAQGTVLMLKQVLQWWYQEELVLGDSGLLQGDHTGILQAHPRRGQGKQQGRDATIHSTVRDAAQQHEWPPHGYQYWEGGPVSECPQIMAAPSS